MQIGLNPGHPDASQGGRFRWPVSLHGASLAGDALRVGMPIDSAGIQLEPQDDRLHVVRCSIPVGRGYRRVLARLPSRDAWPLPAWISWTTADSANSSTLPSFHGPVASASAMSPLSPEPVDVLKN